MFYQVTIDTWFVRVDVVLKLYWFESRFYQVALVNKIERYNCRPLIYAPCERNSSSLITRDLVLFAGHEASLVRLDSPLMT